ncbi:DsbA family protein [Aquipuribacter sp. MA13-6]|uniref:DsbA family protein n=1 Tax=unclassified Aquipuribacter TaxID=2635084 RepID=UPI003EEEB963
MSPKKNSAKNGPTSSASSSARSGDRAGGRPTGGARSVPRSGRGTPLGDARRGSRVVLAVTAVVVAVLVGVTVTAVVVATRQQADLASTDPDVVQQQAFPGTPAEGQDETGGVVVGGTGPVVLTLYEDFLCPACRQLEETSGAYLAELEAGTEVTVEYRPIAILDRLSAGSDYSTRSAAAAMCVAEHDGDATFRAYVGALFAAQPSEGGPGPDDGALAGLATSVGAGEQTTACIDQGRFTGWVTRSTQQAQQLGVGGTPTVWVDGEASEARTPEQLAAAVAAATGS